MSARNKALKRLRYYRRNRKVQDRFARACDLDICKFVGGHCDTCDCEHISLRMWVLLSGGECGDEAIEYVCSNCLPGYYAGKMQEMRYYGTRAFNRWVKQEERQYQYERERVGMEGW